MSSIGTGYDLSSTTYSPDGRVFQVEYAMKAVDASGTAIGIRVSDGVVFGVEKLTAAKMMMPGSNRRVANIGRHIGVAVAGLLADARAVTRIGNNEAAKWQESYGEPIPLRQLVDRVSSVVHIYTLYGGVRPFGCSLLMGSWDAKTGPSLYMVDPSGVSYGYSGCAIGKGKTVAKTDIEKLKLDELTCRQAVLEVTKIIRNVHDDVKDKPYELELSWVCAESGGRHQLVPRELQDEAVRAAVAAAEDSDDSDD
eukprot:c32811_g1_i1.p1 GENE.c32811_g1_i1~~c32811_g1_i1.p1  ORF type:complete len:262 (+),score=57.23 c32811_g1_i1:28-786(+)